MYKKNTLQSIHCILQIICIESKPLFIKFLLLRCTAKKVLNSRSLVYVSQISIYKFPCLLRIIYNIKVDVLTPCHDSQ